MLKLFYNSLDFSKHSHQFWIIFVTPIFDEKYPPIFLRYFLYIRKIQVLIYPYLPIFQSLGVQDYHLWRILSYSGKLVCLFPLTKDRWYSLHTLVKHTFISCTLSNLYMVIWIGTSLIMIIEQNYTTIFLLF